MQESNYQGPGIYEHYKGTRYAVLGLGLQEAKVDKKRSLVPAEAMSVVYRPLTPGSFLDDRIENFWIRDLLVFDEPVSLDYNHLVRRFELKRKFSRGSDARF